MSLERRRLADPRLAEAREAGVAVTLDDYNTFCGSLPMTTHVWPWGGAQAWKVGGKVFAIAGWNDEEAAPFVTFKASPLSFDVLKEQPGCRPAPYLASRGLMWIQRLDPESIDDEALRADLAESHRLVASGLPKCIQAQSGLASPAKRPVAPALDVTLATRSRTKTRSSRSTGP